ARRRRLHHAAARTLRHGSGDHRCDRSRPLGGTGGTQRRRSTRFLRTAILVAALGCAPPVVEHPKDWFELSSAERSDRLFDALGTYPRNVRVESGELRFVELGPSSPTPWLFVHGLAGTLGDFAPLIVSAGAKEHVLAVDLPGFGGSVSIDSDYTVAGFAKV